MLICYEEQIKKDYNKWDKNSSTKGIIIIGKDDENETVEGKITLQKEIPLFCFNRRMKGATTETFSMDYDGFG